MASPIPPNMLAMLMGGNPPMQPQAAPAPAAAPPDEAALLRHALMLVRQAIAGNGVDDQERLGLEKITTGIQQILAARDQQQQAALGGGPATNFLRRITSGAA